MTPTSLLDPTFLRRLDALALAAKHAVVGAALAERRSRRRGSSIEFADYRPYIEGDDFRYIDWNLYGRLGRLYLKLFVAEEDLDVRIYVDTSASMGFGEPSKLFFGAQLAAALAYLGLRLGDRVSVQGFGADLEAGSEPSRGRGRIWRVFEYLAGLVAEGETDFGRAFGQSARGGRAAAFVISDFLSPSGYEEGLRACAGRNSQVTLLHVMTGAERNPEVYGDLALEDIETGARVEVTASGSVKRAYRTAFEAHARSIAQFGRRYGMTYVAAPVEEPLEQLILQSLRSTGVVT